MAVKTNGTVVGWGYNGDGRATPPTNLANVVSLSSGTYHSLAVKSDGTVAAWGFNGNGMINVPAKLTEVLAVAAGGFHSLAVHWDGTVTGWGFGGNGRTIAPATLTDVIAIAAGRDHSLALKSQGTVVAWGLNDVGQTNVPPGLAGVIAIAAGDTHNLALKSNGTVVAWGLNDAGQTSVPVGLSNVVAIAAGAQHSLALKNDGTIVSWGSNANGQRNFTGSNFRSISAGAYHSLALTGSGPLIIKQPLSQTVLSGSPVTFTVESSGSGLSYQWFYNGEILNGQTGAALSIPEAARIHAGVYTVRVSNTGGSVVSANAVLIVRGLQQIVAPQLLAGGVLRLVFGDQNGDPISGPNALRYGVQVSPDLSTWTNLNLPLVLVNGQLQLDDPDAVNHPQRFYRVVEK